jgi:hypothetical protein
MKKISRVSVILLTQTRKLAAFLNTHYPTITIISIDILNHTLLIKSYHGKMNIKICKLSNQSA